ncbi:flagellar motor switch protein FliG [Halanaerobium congolense]|jgi:flagellar motor switch protein FliG|uniref:Flagellar motor switch protein FliG n=1 Tax=Halanaerobium congolense TaxID=54121 RepID=A0A1G8I1N3_9FIRM|nr:MULTISPECIES: flagellar motor switch protein FliG [Halanaerobium]KXS49969.1 MAG: flagellar motor switch protein FliG [Halanaerobium sp. T82-1]PTX16509.1 flagellar motor switch protein FliG [Halanaerobium congolense]PUU89069.1 MAG: flagellar motor switch protein FliG [Halanaerobium sp.]PUU92840.1 MAG: Flagellar motor switch protein FliG [Halanaerobium sp.]TDP26353.1 flagellar motor switch protein FliG [Halanaerobium congolense]
MRDELTGKEKAAILLISLGPEISSDIFKHLDDDEVEKLTLEIANQNKIDPSLKKEIQQEFINLQQANSYINSGGINYAKKILEKSFGPEKTKEIINRLTATLQVRPFDSIRKSDPAQLLNFIQGEHPQTIALILAYIDPAQASQVISMLSTDVQSEVAKRIAMMDRTSPEIIKEVESVLDKKLSAVASNEYARAGGIQSIVDVLNQVDRGTEKNILDKLEEDDPELVEEIKKRMFVFEDIVLLTDRAVQLVLRQVETHDLALALKTASDEVGNIIKSNMSQRAAEMLEEDMEFMGPVRIREVEDAQQRIVNVIRELEESGEIVIARGGEGEVVV